MSAEQAAEDGNWADLPGGRGWELGGSVRRQRIGTGRLCQAAEDGNWAALSGGRGRELGCSVGAAEHGMSDGNQMATCWKLSSSTSTSTMADELAAAVSRRLTKGALHNTRMAVSNILALDKCPHCSRPITTQSHTPLRVRARRATSPSPSVACSSRLAGGLLLLPQGRMDTLSNGILCMLADILTGAYGAMVWLG